MAKKNLAMAGIVFGLTALAATVMYWCDDSASDLSGDTRQLAARSNVAADQRAATTVVDVVWFKRSNTNHCPMSCMDPIHMMFGPEVTVVHHNLVNPSQRLPPSSNLLVVARQVHVARLARKLQTLREKDETGDKKHGGAPAFVGLFEMADELNTFGNAPYYGQFDYVLRNYYFRELRGAPSSMYLRALGNLTCGTALPEYPKPDPHPWPYHHKGDARYGENREPWLGVHWLTNENGSPQPLSAVIPSSKRPVDCSFVGSMRSHRQEMVDTFSSGDGGNAINCTMEIFSKFGGSIPKEEYLERYVARSKITLAPWGNSHETIRAAESLNYASVPVIVRDEDDAHEYIHKFFRPIPALYAAGWEEARDMVRDALGNWEPDRLDELQARGVEWKHEHQECIRSDMLKILSHNPSGFNIANE